MERWTIPLAQMRLPLRFALDAATLYDATDTKYAPDVLALASPHAMSGADSFQDEMCPKAESREALPRCRARIHLHLDDPPSLRDGVWNSPSR